jgi:hypothetical protein
MRGWQSTAVPVRITERDRAWVRWSNGFGSVSVEQTSVWAANDYSTSARRLRLLATAGFVKRIEIGALGTVAWVPTSAACAEAGDTLKPIAGIRIGTYRHDSLLPDLARALEGRTGGRFEPERRLCAGPIGRLEHVPDGVLHRPGRGPVAIELELTAKAPERLRAIIAKYAANMHIEAVWYIVQTDEVKRLVERCARDHSHIRVVRWRPQRGSKSEAKQD